MTVRTAPNRRLGPGLRRPPLRGCGRSGSSSETQNGTKPPPTKEAPGFEHIGRKTREHSGTESDRLLKFEGLLLAGCTEAASECWSQPALAKQRTLRGFDAATIIGCSETCRTATWRLEISALAWEWVRWTLREDADFGRLS